MLKTTDICPVTAAFELDKGEETFRKFLRINQIGIDHYYDSRTLLLNEISDQNRVALLVKLGANILLPTKNENRLTALHMAAKCYKDQSLNLFLVDLKRSGRIEEGINIKDAKGNSPLHYACITAHEKSIDLLLEYGADTSVRNNEGKLPIECLDELKRLDPTQRANLEKKLKTHTASNDSHKLQNSSTPPHTVKKVNSTESSDERSAAPLPVIATSQNDSENFDRELNLLASQRMLRNSPASKELDATIEKIRSHSRNQPKQPLFKFDQVEINRERLTLDLSERTIQMYFREYKDIKRKGLKLLDPASLSFARIYVLLEHFILALDLGRISELEKILDDEAELLWKSGFDSSKTRTFKHILESIKLPGPIANQNGLSSENFARSKLLPWFEQHRSCPAAVRIYGELDDFEKAIKLLSKKSAPSDAVVQMIKRMVEQTCRTGYEQSEAVKEYVNNRTQPQQQQAQSSAIPVPALPPKPIERKNSMDRTQSHTTFFGPTRQKTPSPPQGGSLSGSPESGEHSPKSSDASHTQQDVDEALFQACEEGDFVAVRDLVENHNANVNFVSPPENYTPLRGAILTDNHDIKLTEYLIRNGANVNFVDTQGVSPLHYATIKNRPEDVKLLLDNGAIVDPINDKTLTPLMYAASDGKILLVKLLTESGADPLRTCNGDHKVNAIQFAAAAKHFEIVQYLETYNQAPQSNPILKAIRDEKPQETAPTAPHIITTTKTENKKCCLM